MTEISNPHLTNDATLDLTDQVIAGALAGVRADFQLHGMRALPMFRTTPPDGVPERNSFGSGIVLEPCRLVVGRLVLGTAIGRFEGALGYRFEPNPNGLLIRSEADLDLYSLLAMIKASDVMRHRSDYLTWALDLPSRFQSPLPAQRGSLKPSANGG